MNAPPSTARRRPPASRRGGADAEEPRDLWPLLPILVGVVSLGCAARAWLLALALGSLAIGVTSIGPRWQVDVGRQVLTGAVLGSLGYFLASLLHEPEPGALTEGWTRLSAAALLGAAGPSLLVAPRGGHLPMLGLTFAALIVTGRAPHRAYAPLIVLFLSSSLAVLASQRPRLPRAGNGRRRAAGAGIVLSAAALLIGSTWGLRELHAWVTQRTRYRTYDRLPQTGFSDRMELGALDGLLDSTRRVLRVHGGRVDYLRGSALDIYEAGRWVRSDDAGRETRITTQARPAHEGGVEIVLVGGRGRRFFLPLQASEIATVPSSVFVDALGAMRRQSKSGPASVRFVPGGGAARTLLPRLIDLQLPRRHRARLEALAAEWTAGSVDDVARLAAIERRLRRDYGYARSFERPNGTDPLIDFLFRDKRGHCEYFASALALLGRAAGIPTRVVMGYRVAERSPFGYYVVRERNAHAWVEAWVPGLGWLTRDATPESELPHNREHTASYAASAWDALAVGYDDLTSWLGQRTLGQTSVAWLLGSLVLAIIVARGARRRAKPAPSHPDEQPLPFFRPLLVELARRGHGRAADESLESLAGRVPDPTSAQLIRRYAAYRYGDLGDPGELARDVQRHARPNRDRGP